MVSRSADVLPILQKRRQVDQAILLSSVLTAVTVPNVCI